MIALICLGTVALLFFCNMVYGGWVRRSELEQCRAYYVSQHMDESDIDRKCGVQGRLKNAAPGW